MSPEMSGLPARTSELRLWREDIYGNQYRMPLVFETDKEAEATRDHFIEKGHHQTYMLRPLSDENEPGFIPGRQ